MLPDVAKGIELRILRWEDDSGLSGGRGSVQCHPGSLEGGDRDEAEGESLEDTLLLALRREEGGP